MTDNKRNIFVFVLLHTIAAALFFSWWLDGPVREMWKTVDVSTFRWLNGLLENNPGQQKFWAIANHRVFDLASAVLFAIIYAHFILSDHQQHVARRIGLFLFISLFCFAIIEMFHLILENIGQLGYEGMYGKPKESRVSPSRVVSGALRLTELMPHIKAKDASGHSFPSDHAAVLFIYSGYFFIFLGWKRGMAGLLIAIVFSTPRLVSGAHWFTDNYIGGLGVALVTLAWITITPVRNAAYKWLEPLGRVLAPLLLVPLRLLRIIK